MNSSKPTLTITTEAEATALRVSLLNQHNAFARYLEGSPDPVAAAQLSVVDGLLEQVLRVLPDMRTYERQLRINRHDTCSRDNGCKQLRAVDPREGEVAVEVTVEHNGIPFVFVGRGSDANYATGDAYEHAGDYLGDFDMVADPRTL